MIKNASVKLVRKSGREEARKYGSMEVRNDLHYGINYS